MAIMQESYNKHLIVLIHGIKEDEGNGWEKRGATVQKFKTFLTLFVPRGANLPPLSVILI